MSFYMNEDEPFHRFARLFPHQMNTTTNDTTFKISHVPYWQSPDRQPDLCEKQSISVYELFRRAKDSTKENELSEGIQCFFDAFKQCYPHITSVSYPMNHHQSSFNDPPLIDSEEQYWKLDFPEDLSDEEFLFTRYEFQRRRNSAYRWQTKHLYDLHITMPICIPYGEIVVECPLGANFYRFDRNKYEGAHLLFGKGIADQAKDSSKIHPTTSETTDATESGDINMSELKFSSQDKSNDQTVNSACDVWASFLQIRLGTIYNLTETDVVDVVTRFQSAFDHEMCYFFKPISIDCHGLYPSTDSAISCRTRKKSGPATNERYETHGFPTSTNDMIRLRMIRRYIKRFALQLVEELGFNMPDPDHTMQPLPCIELHRNLRTSVLKDEGIKIVVREWSFLDNLSIFKKIWKKQLGATNAKCGVAETVRAKIFEDKDIPSARVFSGEVRLELAHSRMVDPRWPDDLVIGRRIVDAYPAERVPVDCPKARFVFCDRIEKPKITIAYATDRASAEQIALESRLHDVYEVHLKALKNEKAHTNSPSPSAPCELPMPAYCQGICKFYTSPGGCVRAEQCKFLHPVDPLLKVCIDVRHVIPQHPKYYP